MTCLISEQKIPTRLYCYIINISTAFTGNITDKQVKSQFGNKPLQEFYDMRLLVITSTFPNSDSDPIPSFVKDQVYAFKAEYPDMAISVLAPHDAYNRSETQKDYPAEENIFTEERFHYIWPHQLERLSGRGIIPTLQKNAAYYLLIPFFMIGEFFSLWRLAKKFKPDLLYAHWFTPQGIVAGTVSRITGIPFAYTSHSSDVAILRKIPVLGPFIAQSISKRAQAITVVSQRALEKLKSFFDKSEWTLIKDKVSVIPMGVHIDSVPEPIPDKSPKEILFLGRLVEKKGVQYLLPAFAQISQQFPDVHLTIAGDGPWLDQLKQQADNLDISSERIRFTGYVSGAVKENIIRSADIFVVPSIITSQGDMEGLPVTLLEGLAAGKICIATNESGADDILTDSIDGLLVPQRDVNALHHALLSIIDLAPEKIKQLKKNARTRAKQFSWPEIAKAHYKALFGNAD